MPVSPTVLRHARNWATGTIIALTFAVMLYALGCVISDPAKGIKSSDAASWIQAIGSIAAILGAVGIYRHQTSQQNSDREMLAGLAAARFSPSIALLSSECRRMHDALSDEFALAFNSEPYTKAMQILTFEFHWQLSELQALSLLPNDCAKKFASGLGYFEAAVNLLKKAIGNPNLERSTTYRIDTAVKLTRLLDVAARELEVAARQMHDGSPP